MSTYVSNLPPAKKIVVSKAMCSTSSAMPGCSTWPPATAGYSAWACAFHRSQWLRPGPACRREPGSWESGRQGILLASWLHQHPPTSSIYHDISTIQGRWCSCWVGYDWLCIWIKPLQTLASATLLAGAARAGSKQCSCAFKGFKFDQRGNCLARIGSPELRLA